MSGLRIAVLYGIRPHQLGFCGPQEKLATRTLLKYLSGKQVPQPKIKKILSKFEGAYSYYQLIAKSNRIKNPFDKRVVEAYWIGNRLLGKVSAKTLREMIIDKFSRRGLLSKKIAMQKARKVPAGAVPHHSFHVLVIGSITGRIKLTEKLLDFCRVGWGKITKPEPKNNRIRVKYRPLIRLGKYRLGKPKEIYINWDRDLLPKLEIGQNISFHWKRVVQVLNKADLENLQKYTLETLRTCKRN